VWGHDAPSRPDVPPVLAGAYAFAREVWEHHYDGPATGGSEEAEEYLLNQD